MEETNFKCNVCGKECEELWSFGGYGENPFIKSDKREFCKEHFYEADAEHKREYSTILESNSEDN